MQLGNQNCWREEHYLGRCDKSADWQMWEVDTGRMYRWTKGTVRDVQDSTCQFHSTCQSQLWAESRPHIGYSLSGPPSPS